MEGLIPFVIHAIKRRRERSTYRCLSRSLRPHHLPDLEQAETEPTAAATEFRHQQPHRRRTQSELPAFDPDHRSRRSPERRMGPSRSLREVVFFPRSSDAAAA
ncbi:hypothetical protein Cni_G12655 [Canna indica]|uniref:Uncharacterized protein n=1 Tax=Canna indica TaxID=4628 RepID=A0AAQ3KA93_9LILI|nr:hypothetical protein Cni_G12655 [Canna indica]